MKKVCQDIYKLDCRLLTNDLAYFSPYTRSGYTLITRLRSNRMSVLLVAPTSDPWMVKKMIFPCSFIELAVVDAHPPSSDSLSWNEIILFIMDYCHSSFLGQHLDWTYLSTAKDRVDKSSLQQLKEFLPNFLLYGWLSLYCNCLTGLYLSSILILCMQ